MFATILGYIFPIAGLGLVGLAVAAYIYIPVFGRAIATVLIIIAAGTFAYDAGYRMRGKLDTSATLQAANVELQRELDEAKTVAVNAATNEQAAIAAADANQQKVDSYVDQLSKSPGCSLTDDDVRGLLGIQ